jgi:hypothetical protein
LSGAQRVPKPPLGRGPTGFGVCDHTGADATLLTAVRARGRFADVGRKREQLVHEGYGRNYRRLVEVMTKHDPKNLFRLNANIESRG